MNTIKFKDEERPLTHREVYYKYIQPSQRGREYRLDASEIGNRADLYRRIDKATRDGKVSINVDQMDCDCSRWTSGTVMDAVPRRAVERYIESDIYGAAEGPIYWIGIQQPEHKAEYTSRDLALEAFEDGHAHSVSMERYDEDGHY
jgi:hypothetical protein